MENISINSKIKQLQIVNVGNEQIGQVIRIRGWISTIRQTKHVTFIALREFLDTIQCVIENSKGLVGGMNLVPECFIEIYGEVKGVKKAVKGCTKKDVEIEVCAVKMISSVRGTLPFSLKDASAGEEERKNNGGICNVGYSLRLDHRYLEFRTSPMLSIIVITDCVMHTFREYLRREGFIEVKTTKIIASGSEGGANLFSMDYFGTKAYLAQSPQLYKQMMIAGGLKRVYEVGHVYRAEQSNTNRYLSEFTGLDIEMEIEQDYNTVIKFIYKMFLAIFETIKKECGRELEIIRHYNHFDDLRYTEDPVILTHEKCVTMLQEGGIDIGFRDDFSRETERKLGEMVGKKYNVDFFVVKNYPGEQRAFYTYVDKLSGTSHSYDFIMRGEEILSGAERIRDYDDLLKAITEKGICPESINCYLECFKYGVPPHAGCGIGLERFLKAFFGFDDIRYFSLFPRDPTRLTP